MYKVSSHSDKKLPYNKFLLVNSFKFLSPPLGLSINHIWILSDRYMHNMHLRFTILAKLLKQSLVY